MKKTIIGALFIILLAVGGYFGFQQYRVLQVLHTLKPTVQLASAYLDEFYALEKNSGDLTLAEYDEKANAAVDDLEKKLAELKNRTGQGHEELYSMVVTHVETSRQSIREFSAFARLRMDHEFAKEAADTSVSKLHTSRNHREFKYARSNAGAAIKDLKEARLKSEKSFALVYASAAQVKSQRHVLQNRFGTKSVVSKDGLDYILNKYSGEPGKNPA
ncbi:MAG TPA: hypothetical protein VGU61_17520 [Noviherbaspirillum sp.]|jgi:hypothetical protein|uniref:hypothetical protein n=1 Tax=Noviherbaspirillum sp. TaxID=1926288 RepID=UPI002DDD5D8D|nr:hypothetical protein [Noviherbaspirillum sp.]HEV2612068.1 hypothetical protein [Noviherbaspirillum sp.]